VARNEADVMAERNISQRSLGGAHDNHQREPLMSAAIAVSRYANMNRLAAFNATADVVEGGVRQLMTQVCIGAASHLPPRLSPNSAESKAASTCSILRKSFGVAEGARSCPIVHQIDRWLNRGSACRSSRRRAWKS
jgi:hypothetical protein